MFIKPSFILNLVGLRSSPNKFGSLIYFQLSWPSRKFAIAFMLKIEARYLMEVFWRLGECSSFSTTYKVKRPISAITKSNRFYEQCKNWLEIKSIKLFCSYIYHYIFTEKRRVEQQFYNFFSEIRNYFFYFGSHIFPKNFAIFIFIIDQQSLLHLIGVHIICQKEPKNVFWKNFENSSRTSLSFFWKRSWNFGKLQIIRANWFPVSIVWLHLLSSKPWNKRCYHNFLPVHHANWHGSQSSRFSKQIQ